MYLSDSGGHGNLWVMKLDATEARQINYERDAGVALGVPECRREMLDHVIPLNKQHLRRLGRDYLTYYHEDRTHIGPEKETPARRPIESHPTGLPLPRIGGLHHRYTWSEAA